jgi:hypothetical protein
VTESKSASYFQGLTRSSHVKTTSTKRKLTEVESSESESEEDSDEVQDDVTKDEDYEDGTKKGKSKAKPGSATKPSSDPFAGPDDEYIDPSQGPLRLRAKPTAKAKKDSLKSHAASFQPVGPKTGPPSPKRTKQTTVMEPPTLMPMNNSSGPPPHMPS